MVRRSFFVCGSQVLVLVVRRSLFQWFAVFFSIGSQVVVLRSFDKRGWLEVRTILGVVRREGSGAI